MNAPFVQWIISLTTTVLSMLFWAPSLLMGLIARSMAIAIPKACRYTGVRDDRAWAEAAEDGRSSKLNKCRIPAHC